MEKSVEWEFDTYMQEIFQMKEVDIKEYSPLTLAYIGDGIYDLVIRSIVVGRGNTRASQLHNTTSKVVKAHTQAMMIEALSHMLTEVEMDVYRRGRNAKSPTMAKNATMADYRKATGFEALMGYLYLNDELERIVELTKKGLELLELKL